jgi:6-methylsalicylate decarboxylase
MVEGWTPRLACDALDKAGIATAIVQMKAAPGVWFGDVAAAQDLAREWNEYTAQMTRDFPGRFGMFAVLPMPDIDTTLREIEYAFDVLDADGVQLMSHYEFKYPGRSALLGCTFCPAFDRPQSSSRSTPRARSSVLC